MKREVFAVLIDLYLNGKQVVVFGGGGEAELKIVKALDGGAKITVVSKYFTQGIMRLADAGKVRVIEYDLKDGYSALKKQIGKPYVVFLATDDFKLNQRGVEFAKGLGAIVCVVDTPELCDFAMPAIAKIGDIRIGISTGGRSPIVAKLIRQRIEGLITDEDLVQLELQEYARRKIRSRMNAFPLRKKFLWKIIEDDEIQNLVKARKLEQAKLLVDRRVG